MIFTQYYLDCLSQASYLVADEGTGEAVIVDPRRDIAEYLADAEKQGLTIVGVINTHFHADFVSGHLELAVATGAWIGYGEAADADFEVRKLADGERISLGDVTLEVMATPGHTPESISVLVYEHADDEIAYGVLTGDALFIGDVGRPDLLASVGLTADELGTMLYDSIQNKLMGLPDAVRVFPAHGAGSACGKNLSTETQSTIGEQRRTNYACAPMTEEQFVAVVTAGQPAAPSSSTSATPASWRTAPSPAPPTCRWRSCAGAWTSWTGTRPSSCTARAAGGPASGRASCAPTASRTSRTSSAATPGTRPRSAGHE